MNKPAGFEEHFEPDLAARGFFRCFFQFGIFAFDLRLQLVNLPDSLFEAAIIKVGFGTEEMENVLIQTGPIELFQPFRRCFRIRRRTGFGERPFQRLSVSFLMGLDRKRGRGMENEGSAEREKQREPDSLRYF